MPVYDYGCPTCGTQREVTHSISEIGKIQVGCDHCGATMTKQLSMPALIGFDNVGRSVTKKEKSDSASCETSAAPSCNGCACSAA